MKVVGVIQARLSSSRLPGKTLLPIHGRPMLIRIWERLCFCKRLDSIVVATSDDPANEPIRALCQREGIGCVSATTNDAKVGERLLAAAEATSADAIVRITPDCPLVDYGLVDQAVAVGTADFFGHSRLPMDYVSNVFPRYFPDGLDVEYISLECLRVLRHFGEEPTRHVWEHSEEFRIASLPNMENLSHLNWTVNHLEDLEFARWVYGMLPEGFRWTDVLALAQQAPAFFARRFPFGACVGPV